ncbi:dentin sialophosphoprotein-like [Physella acuta]|uniref:dentin sialophosphoprotein-like n=1 Tax=Physella acuta TaxID=109671 RepID=UPI0027DC621C|nr:dentin sialophosphoprotein-like [Physella acuta]
MVLLLFYRKFRRLKSRTRTSSQIDEMTLPYPRGGHYPGRRQVPSSLPAALTNQAISVKNKISASLTSNKNGSLLKQKNGDARKQASGFPIPDVDEYNQMSNFEEIELDSLSSADYPDADVYNLQESRFYDYGYGSSNLTSFEKRFHKYVRESSNKSTASLQSSGNSAPILPHTPLDGAGSSIEHHQTSAPSLQQYKDSTKLPPVKPKRTFDYMNSHLHRGFENRGYAHDYDGVDHVTEDRWSNTQEEQDSDSVSELNSPAHDRIHDSATESEGTQETVSAGSSSASEKRPRILKCVSFDESQLKATNARLRVNDQTPRRKVSTVSVPSSEHLEVPDSGFKKPRSMYETVDNLAAVSEDSPPTTQFFIGNSSDTSAINEDVKSSSLTRKKTPNTEPESALNEPKTSNQKLDFDASRKSEEKHVMQDGPEVKVKSDFVTPIISVAAKKILEGRNSRKLKQQNSCEGAGDEGVSRYLASGDISKYTEYIRDRTSSAPASALVSPAPPNKTVQILNVQNIPKIILTKEDSSAKDDANKPQEQIALAPSRTRRIARANNPFLIEVDRSASASEKVRRASAPSMPLGSKANDGGTREDMMTRSASGEFLSAGLGGRSHASPHTARSWSAEFYDLMAKSRANDPLNDKFFKQMIDERYETLFGRKYPEISSLSRSPAMSPRVVKRRAAERKVASLDRDLNPHKLMMMLNKESEIDAQLTGNRWSSRRFYREDAPQDTYTSGLKNNPKKFSNLNVAQRPVLMPGTDGCEDDSGRSEENGPASHKDNILENSITGSKMKPPRNTSLSEVTELRTGDSITRMDQDDGSGKEDGGHQVTSGKSSVDMRTKNPQSSTRRPVSDSMIFFQDNTLNFQTDRDPPSKYYRSDDPPSKYYRSHDPPSRFYTPDDPPSERYMLDDPQAKHYRPDDQSAKLNKPITEQTPLENKPRGLERQRDIDSDTETNPDETSDTETTTRPHETYSVGWEHQDQSPSKTQVKPYRRNRRIFSSEDGVNVTDEIHQNTTTSKEEELIQPHHDVTLIQQHRDVTLIQQHRDVTEFCDHDDSNSEASGQDDAHALGSSEADSSDSSTDSEDDSGDASSYTINMEDTAEDDNITLGGLYTHQSSNV